jgi:hypothetical protein
LKSLEEIQEEFFLRKSIWNVLQMWKFLNFL